MPFKLEFASEVFDVLVGARRTDLVRVHSNRAPFTQSEEPRSAKLDTCGRTHVAAQPQHFTVSLRH